MSLALEQPLLFDPAQFPSGSELLLPREEQAHRFTGEIIAKNEAKYLAIVHALGQGMGRRQIARAFGVSHHTVQAIWEREPVLVATEKEKTGRQLRRVTRMSLDALEEALDEGRITHGQLPVTTAILLDKSMAWDGQATTVVAVRHEIDQHKVRALFESLRPPLEAEILSPDSESSGTASNAQQIAALAVDATPDVAPLALPTTTETTTTVPGGFDMAPPSTTTHTTAAAASPPPPTDSGGGGGRISAAGRRETMGCLSEILT